MNSFVLIVSFIGIITLIALWLWIQQREGISRESGIDAILKAVPSHLAEGTSAVLVAGQHGDLIHLNPLARQWVGMIGAEPDLEDILRRAEPSDNLLSLLSTETKASFQLGQRWIEASSHYVPDVEGARMVIVMRELQKQTSQSADDNFMDVSLAMTVINEIGEVVDASIGVEPALQMLLDSINKAIPSDAGEICLWDDERNFLQQRGWIGDTRYLLTVATQGGGYNLGQGLAGWVAQYHKAIVVTGANDAVNTRELMQNNPYKSAVAVPIILGEVFVGTIALFSNQIQHYSLERVSLLQAISKPIGTAIRNAEMYARQEDRIRDIASLQQIAESPKGNRGDAESVYRLLNERMAKLMNADMCGVFLYEESREALIPQVPFYGLPDHVADKIIIPIPQGSPQREIWLHQPYWVAPDLRDEPLVEALNLKPLVEVAGIENTALFPMQIAGERFGILAISNKRSEAGFLPTDIQNLRVLTSQATIVVENVRLYQRERRIDTELVGLQEMTHAIGALSHEGEFYQEISERIARLTQTELCGILLYDRSRRALVSQLPFYGIPPEILGDYAINLPRGSVMEQLWQDESYWYSNRVQSDTLVFTAGLEELAEKANIRKTLIAVMSAGGRRIGVVQISNKIDGTDFDEQDARLVQIFATQAAAIIENARLYREVQLRADQAESLRRVAELASTSSSSEDSFKPVLAEIAALTNSEMVYISIVDHNTNTLVTYPRWMYGVDLDEPMIQDLSQPGYEAIPALSGRYFLSNKLRTDERVLPSYKRIAERFNIERSILVPLTVGDRILGELGVSNKRSGLYTQDDVATFSTVAAQIASSVERQMLFEATGENLRRRVEELDAIARVSNTLTLTMELDRVLEVIRDESAKTTYAQASSILILRPQDDWQAFDKPEIEKRIGQIEGLLTIAPIEQAAILRGGEALIVQDYEQSDFSAIPVTARSAAVSVILYLDKVVGVIHIYDEKPNAFDDRASGFLMTLATKASLAYQNALLYEQQQERGERLRQRVDQLNRIFELGQMLQSETGADVILEAIAYSIQQSVGYDTVLMTLFDEDDGRLHRVAHAGLPLGTFNTSKSLTLSRDDLKDLLKEEYHSSESYFFPIEDLEKWYHPNIRVLSASYDDNRSVEARGKRWWHEGDMLFVTIVGKGGDLLGIISLDRPYDNLRPERTSIEVLEIFAHQASTMLENTRLFRESQQNVEREARLNETLEAIAGTLDLREMANALASGLQNLVTYDRMTLVLRDVGADTFNYLRISIDNETHRPLIQEAQHATLQDTILGEVYSEHQVVTYNRNSLEVQRYVDLKQWFQEGERSAILLPLSAGGEKLGVLHIGSSKEGTFEDAEVHQLLVRASQLIASTVQNVRLFNQTMNLQILNRSVVESIQQGIIVLDNSGRVISHNEYMRRTYKWTDEANGKDLFVYAPDLAATLTTSLKEVLLHGEQREHLSETSMRENDIIVRNFYLYPLRSGQSVRGAVLLVEDVTERAKLEEAIEARANQLAALTEVSTRITASLEREEVVTLAMNEMAWIIPYDGMSIWRRNGSFMVLEGTAGFDTLVETELRLKITEFDFMNQLVDTQRVVSTNDSPTTPRLGLPDDDDKRSWMGVPLVNQGHVVGMFLLAKEDANAYDTRQEQNVAFAFASQVAIALANADLFEQTFERTNELGTLLEAASMTSLTRDINEVFRNVAELMFSALEMENCNIMIWDEVDNQLEVQFSGNRMSDSEREVKKGTRYNVKDFPARQQALRNREVVVMIDTVDADRLPYQSELEEMRTVGYGSRMLVPLVVRDQAIGLLQLDQASHEADSITQQNVRLARALGSQVAVAIENARLTTETTARFEQLFTINQLSRSISSTLKLDDMLPIIQDQLAVVTNAEELYLALYDEESLMITFPLAARGGERFLIPPRPMGNDEVSYIIKRKHSLSLGADYFSIDELRKSMGISNGEGAITSYMGVPVKSGDKVLGVLAIRHYHKARAFDINYDNILTTVASQLGAAIQNARLFETIQSSAENLERLVELRTLEVEEERDRLDTLYQITSELARTLDMEQLLERSLGMVSKAVGAQDGVVMLTDPATDNLFSRAWINPDNLIYIEEDDIYTHPAVGLATWLISYDESNDHVVVVYDLNEQDYWDERGRATGLRSAMAVMLENNEDPMGVMVLLSTEVGAFTENHIKLLVPAANQVAAAINSADLYQLIRDQAERMGKLLRAEQEEAQKNSAILESVADGVMLANAAGEIILFNTAAERILELPREQAIGQSVNRLAGIYGPSAIRWSELVNQWSINPQKIGEESATERLQIGDKIISAQLSPVYIGELFLGTVSVFRDITKDVEADRAKAKFIENVSHEFRTPLTPVKGYTDMLLMTAADTLDPMQLDFVQRIKANVDRLATLVDDVLNISKLDSGEEELHMSLTDIRAVINLVFNRIANDPKNLKKNMQAEVQAEENLPLIRADRDKISEVLSNIINNAFNYTLPEGKVIVKAYSLKDHPPAIQIEIVDTGVGIPEEFREAAWRRFERYDKHAVELDIAGTGLGLSISKDLVKLHNGDIWFESTLGVGTTFFIRLPIEQPNFRTSTMEMPKIDETTLAGD